jgi:hypothetical protein
VARAGRHHNLPVFTVTQVFLWSVETLERQLRVWTFIVLLVFERIVRSHWPECSLDISEVEPDQPIREHDRRNTPRASQSVDRALADLQNRRKLVRGQVFGPALLARRT